MTFTRSILDQELAGLQASILRLTSMVKTAVNEAMRSLYERNIVLAQQVMTNDEEINRLRYAIEQNALLVLATQQPAAGDLRSIIAAIHIAVKLERMGDHAAGIARLVNRMAEDDDIDSFHKLPKMEKRVCLMIDEMIDAYTDRSVEKAEKMMRRDDKVDKHYKTLFQETLSEMEETDYIRRATFLLWVGHNLERIGDRLINVAERVIFMVSGEFVENSLDFD